jgi:vacuolar-type H+-ATPase subunit C/Vma6
MTAGWEDVVARVRGLASRRLGRQAIEQLATSRNLNELVGRLETTIYASAATLSPLEPHGIDRETRRVAGDRMKTIGAWCGERAELLAPLFEDEDRRNLRAIARNIVAHVPADQCVAGLLPTPALPVWALDELSHRERLRDVAATLGTWGNPYGTAMMAEALRETPDLFTLHLAIDRAYAKRAVPIAKRADDSLVWYVRMLIDGENARAALAVASGSVEHAVRTLYIEGGELVSRELFADLATCEPGEARAKLARVFAGTVLAPVVTGVGDELSAATLTAMLRHLRRVVRIDPLSLSVVLHYVLELRAELQDLARIIWGIALQVPRRRLVARLVTP